VIELRSRPRSRRMAHGAGIWKTSCAVIWIICVVEVLEVTTGAVGRNGGKVPTHVALRAHSANVCSG
jgi:hypothetical protein